MIFHHRDQLWRQDTGGLAADPRGAAFTAATLCPCASSLFCPFDACDRTPFLVRIRTSSDCHIGIAPPLSVFGCITLKISPVCSGPACTTDLLRVFTVGIWKPHHFSLVEKHCVVRPLSCNGVVFHASSPEDQSVVSCCSSFCVRIRFAKI